MALWLHLQVDVGKCQGSPNPRFAYPFCMHVPLCTRVSFCVDTAFVAYAASVKTWALGGRVGDDRGCLWCVAALLSSALSNEKENERSRGKHCRRQRFAPSHTPRCWGNHISLARAATSSVASVPAW